MAHAYRLFKKHAEFIVPVCTLLKKHIYEPIQKGQRLRIGEFKVGADMSFFDVIDQAVKDWESPQDEGIIIVLDDSDDETVQSNETFRTRACLNEDSMEGVERSPFRPRDQNTQGKKAQHASAKRRRL